jgi:hypothetical protein
MLAVAVQACIQEEEGERYALRSLAPTQDIRMEAFHISSQLFQEFDGTAPA